MSVFLEQLIARQSQAAQPRVFASLLAFALVGVSAACGYLVLCNIFVPLVKTMAGWEVSVLCYAAMILPAYALHKRFSFRSSAGHRQALPRYVLVQIMSLSFASAFSFLVYAIWGVPHLPASILVTGLTSGASFVALNLWAFATR
jgi:putative flippase GtrA